MSYRRLRTIPCQTVEMPQGCKPCDAVSAALDECCTIVKKGIECSNPLLQELPKPSSRIPPKNLGKSG